MTSLHLTEPWWYYALFILAVAAVILEFWFIRWSTTVKTRRLERRIKRVPDNDTYLANLCWTHLRQYEAILAHRLGMERLIRENPDRVAALLAEAPRLQVVDDDWAVI